MTYELAVLLARIPLDVAVPLMIGIAVLISVLGTWIVNTIYAPFQLEPNNQVGGSKFNFLGEIYAVTLAVALIGAFDRYTDAQTTVQKEVATLVALDRAADVYDRDDQADTQVRMKSAVREYARAVVEKEWRTMSVGIPSFEVTHRLKQLSDAFLKAEPVTNAQMALQQNTVEWVRQVNESRSFRLTTVSRSLVSLVWILLGLGTAIAIVFPWFFGTTNVLAQATMSAILVSFLVMHLLVVLHLAYPFVGETAISPSAFIAVAQ